MPLRGRRSAPPWLTASEHSPFGRIWISRIVSSRYRHTINSRTIIEVAQPASQIIRSKARPRYSQVLIGGKNRAKVYQKKESFGYVNLKMERFSALCFPLFLARCLPKISFIVFFPEECNVSESINNPMVNVRKEISAATNLRRAAKELMMQKRLSQQLPARSTPGEKNPRVTPTRDRREAARGQKEKQRSPRQGVPAPQRLQCPKCGTVLQQRIIHGAPINECPKCGGLWLDKGAFEQASSSGGDNWIGHLAVDLASMMAHPAPLQPKEGMTWYWY